MSSNHQGVVSVNFTMAEAHGHAELCTINNSQSAITRESSISMEIDRRVEQWSQLVLDKSAYQQSYHQYVGNNIMGLATSLEANNNQTHLNTSPVYNSIQFQNHQVPLPQQPVSMTHLTSNSYPAPSKRPQAHISLVPNTNGGFKAVVKRKRKRTMFTTEQVAYLETIFRSKPYVTPKERQVLVKKLQVSDSAVKVWFQNRRIRGKKENEQALSEYYQDSSPDELSLYNSPNSVQELHTKAENFNSIKTDDIGVTGTVKFNTVNDHSCSSKGYKEGQPPCSSDLDYLEAELNQKADHMGFITLNDNFLDNILKAINNVFTGQFNFNTPLDEAKYEASQEEMLSNSINRCSCEVEDCARENITIDSSAFDEGKSEEEESVDSEVSSYAGSVYEPISPAASESAGEETPTSWKPFAPEHSLQQLFDLHFC